MGVTFGANFNMKNVGKFRWKVATKVLINDFLQSSSKRSINLKKQELLIGPA